MKKKILSFAIFATVIGSVATGCSSERKAGGTDSTATVRDSTSGSMSTTGGDSSRRDTTKTPPKI